MDRLYQNYISLYLVLPGFPRKKYGLKSALKKSFILAAILSALLFVGCRDENRSPQNSEEIREIVDDLGRTVKIPVGINRIVSLAPNLTEIVFAVSAGEKLVGVTTYCDYPAEVRTVAKIGDTLKPNIETIIALQPNIVFVSTASQIEAFTGTLDAQNIAYFVTDPDSLDGIYKSVNQIGEILGTGEQARKVVQNLQNRVAEIENKTKNFYKPKVFVQLDKSLYTIGSDSFITDLIRRAGGESVTKDVPTAYPKISRETALALNPDVIILSDSADNREPNEVFANSKAVKNGKVFRINADILSRPAPRIVEALEQIAGFLHE